MTAKIKHEKKITAIGGMTPENLRLVKAGVLAPPEGEPGKPPKRGQIFTINGIRFIVLSYSKKTKRLNAEPIQESKKEIEKESE